MTRLVIRNPRGRYWTGSGWGLKRQALTYEIGRLPERLEGADLAITESGPVYVDVGNDPSGADARLVAVVEETKV